MINLDNVPLHRVSDLRAVAMIERHNLDIMITSAPAYPTGMLDEEMYLETVKAFDEAHEIVTACEARMFPSCSEVNCPECFDGTTVCSF